MPDDLVSIWDVPMQDQVHRVEFEHGTTTGKRIIRVDGKDQVHRVEFEHGTTTGKRIIRVDGKEILRRDWMFKLVGREPFEIGKIPCAINVETMGTFAYEYTLEVKGKSFKKFTEQQGRSLQTWRTNVDAVPTRVCLDKDSMDVWVNGEKMDTAGEFVESGTETHFEIGAHICFIKAVSTGKRRTGIQMTLFVDGRQVPESDVMH